MGGVERQSRLRFFLVFRVAIAAARAVGAKLRGDFIAPGIARRGKSSRGRARDRSASSGGRHSYDGAFTEGFFAEATFFGATLIDGAALLASLDHRTFCAADGSQKQTERILTAPRAVRLATLMGVWSIEQRACLR